MRASGARSERACAFAAVVTTTAAAPSLMPEALPAVTDPSFLNAGFERAELVGGRARPADTRRPRIARGAPFFCGISTGTISSAKRPFCDRLGRAPLALGRKRILIGARHVVAGGDLLRRDAHVAGVDRARQPFAEHRIDDLAVAHPVAPPRALQQIRRVRHRLGAAGDDRVDVADANRFDGVHDRLQARAADAVDRFAGHLDRQPGLERRLTRHVHAGAGLQDAAQDDVADVGRRDLRAARSLRESPRRRGRRPDRSLSAPPKEPIGVRQALRMTASSPSLFKGPHFPRRR